MVEQPDQKYRKAIESAQRERAELVEKLRDLDKFQKRLIQLDAFIAQGEVLLGIEPIETPESTPPADKSKVWGLPDLDDSKKPLHLKAAQILKEIGKPMRLSDIVEEFRKRSWKLSKNNPREVLRNTFKKVPQKVKKELGEGGQVLYSLREGSPEQ